MLIHREVGLNLPILLIKMRMAAKLKGARQKTLKITRMRRSLRIQRTLTVSTQWSLAMQQSGARTMVLNLPCLVNGNLRTWLQLKRTKMKHKLQTILKMQANRMTRNFRVQISSVAQTLTESLIYKKWVQIKWIICWVNLISSRWARPKSPAVSTISIR